MPMNAYGRMARIYTRPERRPCETRGRLFTRVSSYTGVSYLRSFTRLSRGSRIVTRLFPLFSVSRISIGPSHATNAERAYLVRTPERDSFL